MKTRKIIFSALLSAVLALSFALPASAAAVTDNITVSIGYFGWQNDQYIEKATYSWAELDDLYGGALDTYYTTYSYYSGSRTAVESCRGFLIEDLLNYAGIDLTSVYGISFFTLDYEAAQFTSFTKNDLLYSSRYYFPNIFAKDDDTSDSTGGEIIALNGDDPWEGAVRVQSMLALEDNWEWEAISENYDSLSTSSRFRLVFGQSDPYDKRTNQSARYVYRIHVTFYGSPSISLDETDMELKIGSDYKITPTIQAEDELLDDYVNQNLLWSSSDESVVTVDQSGQISVVGAGNARVTVSFGDSAATVNIAVGEDENLSGGGTGGEGNDPAGGGEGQGTGSGGADVPADNTAPPSQEGAIDPPPESETVTITPDLGETVFIIPSSVLEPQHRQENDSGGLASDAVQLTIPETQPNIPAAVMAVFCGVCVLAGAALGAVKYLIEMRGTKICLKKHSR